jgi:hypothetical protein
MRAARVSKPLAAIHPGSLVGKKGAGIAGSFRFQALVTTSVR